MPKVELNMCDFWRQWRALFAAEFSDRGGEMLIGESWRDKSGLGPPF